VRITRAGGTRDIFGASRAEALRDPDAASYLLRFEWAGADQDGRSADAGERRSSMTRHELVPIAAFT
jgi:hypothetical protein